ncbi:MAG: hypothetical protein PWQ55_1223 [Chloroflexota bacterium]|nr:hypothetical protein [Chloroflexota bacterium]
MQTRRWIIVLALVVGILFSACNGRANTQLPVPSATAPVSGLAEQPTAGLTQTPEPIYFPAKMEGTIPVIFSHDGAPDDIAALVYLSKYPQVELLGVVQSYGEQHPSESLAEWQVFLYDVLDLDTVPIGLGLETPLDPAQNEFPASWRSGADRFWGIPLPQASQAYTAENGPEMIVRLVNTSPQKVVLLVTGAQTDVARALQLDPSIADNIAQIVIMGGAFNRDGNLHEFPGYEDNHVAEWNIYVDPLAASQVFTSGVPLSIVSLDGSDEFVITRSDYDRIAGSDDPGLQVLAHSWEQNFNSWGGDFKIWDIVAAVALTDPGYFTWTYDSVDVVTDPGSTQGQTIHLNTNDKSARFTSITSFPSVKQAVFETLALAE